MNWIALDAQGYIAAKYLLAVLWQSSLLFAGVAVIALLLRNHAPRMRRALWLTALLVAPFLPLLSMLVKPSGLPQQEVAAFPTYTPPMTIARPIAEDRLPVIVTPQHPITPLPVPAPRPLDYPWALALIAYALGSTGFLSWTLLGHLRIRQWICAGKIPSEPRVLEAFREAATRLKLQRRIHVVMTDRVCAPVTVGLFRATVLLPKEVTATLTDDDLVAVAIHETAHIRQHDPLFLTVASLVRSLLFFHPLVWVACRALAVLAEHVADDAVLETTGQPLPYAKLLTTLAEHLPRRTPTVEGAAGLILCKSAFLRRVEAILGDRTRIRRITRLALAGTFAAAVFSLTAALALPLGQIADTRNPAQAKGIKKVHANVVEGPIVLDRDFVLPLEMCKDVSATPKLRFTKENNMVNGVVHVVYPSWPHTCWRARIELIDQDGKAIANKMITFENSGEYYQFGSGISIENQKAELLFSFPANQINSVHHFRFSMETTWTESSLPYRPGENDPLSLTLDGAEYSKALWLDGYRKGNTIKFNAKHLSWPKSTWKVTVILTDSEGKEVAKEEREIANDGTLFDRPAEGLSNVSIPLDKDPALLTRTKQFTVRVEKIDAGTPSATVDTVDSAGNAKRQMAIADLVKTLDSDQPHLREAALNTLKEMGPEAGEAIPALIKALSTYPDQTSCHWIASEILAGLGALAVPALEQAAKSDDALLRIWATAALLSNQEADPTRWQCLSEALQSKDKITCQEALRAVQMLGLKAAPLVPQVTEILRRPNLYFMDTENALTALTRIGSAASPAFPEVIKWLDAAEPLVRIEALRAVKVMDKADRKLALPKLILALRANDTSESFVASQQSRIRKEAAEALGSMGSEARDTLPNLIKTLDDTDEFVRAAVVEAIGRIDPADPTVLPGLIKAMQDPNVRIQHPANRILMELGPVNIEIIRAFIQAIRENGNSFDTSEYDGPAYNIVPMSEDFIRKLKPEHRYAVPDFTALAKDPNPGVQRMAITALTNIGEIPEAFIPMLMENVRKSESVWSEKALILLGPKVAAEVPALIKMLRDPDLSVSVSAARILAAIGRPAAEPAIPVMEECIKAAKFPQESLCQSLLALDPNSTVARDGLARIPAQPGAENKSTFRLSDSTITRAKDAAKAELDARKKPGHGLRDRRPAGLEKADSDAAIAQIIETSMAESVSSVESTRDAAMRRLRYLGDRAFEALTKGLKSDNPKVRAVSASLLQECGTKATPLLSQTLLNDSDITVRATAALSLGNLFDPKGIPALLTALKDPEFRVNMSAVMALMFLRSRETFDPLRAILDNPKADAQLREAAAKALRHIDPANGTKAVQEAFEKEKDESLCHNYQVVLNESPFDYDYWPPELLALRQLTKDAATLAGEQFGDAEIKQLLAYIRSDSNTASNFCLLALGALRVESAVPAIIALGPQKGCVCSALAQIASPEAVAFLLDVLQSPNPEIRKTGIRALGEHAGRWAVPVLVELLDDPGLRKKRDPSPDGMEWPDTHEAHAALWLCLNRAGLKNSILNLADPQGRTFNVDEEIKRTKVWWQEHGEDFLQGKSVPSPNLTAVWWIS